ncbi:MAG: HAD hydrolase-like protein [Myxococcales bacterium]|nr:HAD hydrolase-like protein [Myxococcales bacterium]
MQRLNAFIDLDGPLLDVSRRHHLVYASIVEALGGTPVSIEAYWAAKRSRQGDATLLALSGIPAALEEYEARKLALIESPTYLEHDRLQPEIHSTLSWLCGDYNLYLVTLRRSSRSVKKQLLELSIDGYFRSVLVGQDNSTALPGWKVKCNLVYSACITCTAQDIFVGDTETDIQAGKTLGVRTIAVSNGIRDAELLSKLHPWLMLPGLGSLQTSHLRD